MAVHYLEIVRQAEHDCEAGVLLAQLPAKRTPA
jgi:hypothetical protein